MSKVIHKYSLDAVWVELPHPFKPLCVDRQLGSLYLWAEVDEEPTDFRNCRVYAVPTGERVPTGHKILYLGTVFDRDFVWHRHIYLQKEKEADDE